MQVSRLALCILRILMLLVEAEDNTQFALSYLCTSLCTVVSVGVVILTTQPLIVSGIEKA